MFVSAFSVAELGCGAPWALEIDGSRVIVVDGNVGRAIGMWRHNRGVQTYDALAEWLVTAADQLVLSSLRADPPDRSPRFVQQVVYTFRSRSNRAAFGDRCATSPCGDCPSRVCPFRPDA